MRRIAPLLSQRVCGLRQNTPSQPIATLLPPAPDRRRCNRRNKTRPSRPRRPTPPWRRCPPRPGRHVLTEAPPLIAIADRRATAGLAHGRGAGRAATSEPAAVSLLPRPTGRARYRRELAGLSDRRAAVPAGYSVRGADE